MTVIDNFVFGRGSLDTLLTGPGGYAVRELFLGGNPALPQDNAAVTTDPTGQFGVALIGMFVETAAMHISAAIEGGNNHLLISYTAVPRHQPARLRTNILDALYRDSPRTRKTPCQAARLGFYRFA